MDRKSLMFKLNYTKNGQTISDFEVTNFILNAYERSQDQQLDVANELVFFALRVLIKRGIIDYNNVEILTDGDFLTKIDTFGRFVSFPPIMCIMDNFLDELIF
jgi:hypothetical protein